ncbi:proline racemase family protein [Chengkuizengella sediminis]|uniref:proline racemase family protein n=1 Tax=Chengkuizengella sediminis TaxID=1885917 RepID=UPI00138A1B24|nr:proline racemase family protein [Chengkuizengella sediminis]NDI36204.1 proline racemase family protein [Chengkuizengella sediminis]
MEMVKHFTTTDLHAAGEPLRVITAGIPYIMGSTMKEKQVYFNEHFDYVKKILLSEPRGHLNMKGCIITPPIYEESNFGVLFINHDEDHSFCSHSIIAVITYMLETGMVKLNEEKQVIIDTPSGKVITYPVCKGSQVTEVSFDHLPAYVYKHNIAIHSIGKGLTADLVFSDFFYVMINAEELGIQVVIDQLPELNKWSQIIKKEIEELDLIKEKNQSIKGIVFSETPNHSESNLRFVTIFENGQIDRSPYGAGVGAQLAQLHHKGELETDERIILESIIGVRTHCKISINRKTMTKSIVPHISGRAFITGMHQFVVDPSDPLFEGFLLK